MQFKFQMIRQFFKMCVVGLSGMAVQFVTYNILRSFFSPLWAGQIAILISTVNNFYFHGRVTFKHQGFYFSHLVSRSGYLFLFYSLIMIILQGQWLKWTTYYLGHGVLLENALMVVGVGWGSILNFLFYRRCIWPEKRSLAL